MGPAGTTARPGPRCTLSVSANRRGLRIARPQATIPTVSARQRPLARGELEAKVLDVLWNADGWLVPGEVHAVINPRRRLAYTTIMTTMTRLWEKGRLERRRRGRAFEYCPSLDRTEYAASRMNEFLSAAGDPRSALAHFVSGMDASEEAELRRVLRSKRRSS